MTGTIPSFGLVFPIPELMGHPDFLAPFTSPSAVNISVRARLDTWNTAGVGLLSHPGMMLRVVWFNSHCNSVGSFPWHFQSTWLEQPQRPASHPVTLTSFLGLNVSSDFTLKNLQKENASGNSRLNWHKFQCNHHLPWVLVALILWHNSNTYGEVAVDVQEGKNLPLVKPSHPERKSKQRYLSIHCSTVCSNKNQDNSCQQRTS